MLDCPGAAQTKDDIAQTPRNTRPRACCRRSCDVSGGRALLRESRPLLPSRMPPARRDPASCGLWASSACRIARQPLSRQSPQYLNNARDDQ